MKQNNLIQNISFQSIEQSKTYIFFHKTSKKYTFPCFIFFLIFLSFAYLSNLNFALPNYDRIIYFEQAKDIAFFNNFRLHNWTMHTHNAYFIETLPLAILIKIFGDDYAIYGYLISFYLTVSFVILFYLSKANNLNKFILLPFLYYGLFFGMDGFHYTAKGFHAGLVFYTLLTILIYEKLDKLKIWQIVLFACILGAVNFSHSLFKYLIILPMLILQILAIVNQFGPSKYQTPQIIKFQTKAFILIIVSLVVAKFLEGQFYFIIQNHYIDFSKIPDILFKSRNNLIVLTSIFSPQNYNKLNQFPFFFFISFTALSGLIYLIYQNWQQMINNFKQIDLLMILSISLVFAAIAFGETPFGSSFNSTSRYFVLPGFLFLFILARHLQATYTKQIFITLTICACLTSTVFTDYRNTIIAIRENQEMINALKDEKFGKIAIYNKLSFNVPVDFPTFIYNYPQNTFWGMKFQQANQKIKTLLIPYDNKILDRVKAEHGNDFQITYFKHMQALTFKNEFDFNKNTKTLQTTNKPENFFIYPSLNLKYNHAFGIEKQEDKFYLAKNGWTTAFSLLEFNLDKKLKSLTLNLRQLHNQNDTIQVYLNGKFLGDYKVDNKAIKLENFKKVPFYTTNFLVIKAKNRPKYKLKNNFLAFAEFVSLNAEFINE